MTSIRLTLTKPDGRDDYRPGDAVSGLVYLSLSHDTVQQVKRVELAFSGRSEIECTVRNINAELESFNGLAPFHKNGRIVFFDYVQTICLYDEAHLPNLGDFQWPFSFIFPSQSIPNPSSRTWHTSASLATFPSEPGLPLPPSFSRSGDDWRVSHALGQAKGRVCVIYELEARLVGTSGNYLKRVPLLLQFTPYSRLTAHELHFFKKEHAIQCESRQLSSKVDKSSLRSRAKKFMLKAPVIAFTITTELPTYSTMGDVLPAYIGIEYDLEKSTTTDLPPVLLSEIKIEYLEHVRLGHVQSVYPTNRAAILKSPYTKRHIHFVLKKDNMIPVTERMALHQVLSSDKLIVNELSFETPSIRRSYHEFFLLVTVVCAGQKHTISSRINGSEFSFMPPPRPPKDIELPNSRLLPPEAQSEAVHEVGNGVRVDELQSEPLYELDSDMRSSQVYKPAAFNRFYPT